MIKNKIIRGNTQSKWGIGANVFTHNRQRKYIQELLKIADTEGALTNVLDCPSGSGRMVDLLLSWQVTCADVSKRRLENVKEYFPDDEIVIRECDVFDLPFDNNEFDLILNFLLIQHIDKSKLGLMLKELHRVTARWLLATYPSYFALANLFRLKNKKTMLSKKEFSNLASDVGFRIVESRRTLPFIANGTIVLLEKI
jgi:hypothetical protein